MAEARPVDNENPSLSADPAYPLGEAYDEMFSRDGLTRENYRLLHRRMRSLSVEALGERQRTLERSFLQQGITFTVYGDKRHRADHSHRPFPAHRHRPRNGREIEAGPDPAHAGAEPVPARHLQRPADPEGRRGAARSDLGAASTGARCAACHVPHGAYVNVCGSDLIRNEDGEFVVLEDNLRVPSGVSYMLANRDASRRAFPGAVPRRAACARSSIIRTCCWRRSRAWPATGAPDPQVVVLTPGVFNSAYFEHAFLARQMGVPLVEGRDLLVHDNVVYMRTTSGPEAHRRDLSPHRRRLHRSPDLPPRFGARRVPGLFNAYRAGNVVIANALGTGVADDKAVYAYVPGDHPLLPRRGADPAECRDLPLPRAQLAAAMCWPISTSWWSRRWANRAATACWSARTPAQAEREDFAETAQGRSRQLHRPADHPAFHRALPCRRRGSSRAMSICGPSSCHGAEDRGHARRADPRGAEARQPGGELQPGRRLEGHLGAG